MSTLDLNEAAVLAKCSPDTLRKLAAAREVPSTKVGRKRVFSARELVRYLANPRRYWQNVRRQARRAAGLCTPENNERFVAYYARKRRRFPAWANREAIKAIYQLAREQTARTGVEHEVDHFVPLFGRLVSGLHVETNLCVIQKYTNRSKGNRWAPT